MPIWFTEPDAPVETRWVKRFTPDDWTVDFPRGSIASIVAGPAADGMTVEAQFLRKGDLAGLIYESEDRHAHAARSRRTSRDYSRCRLRFRWKSQGLMPLDAVNGPTLTIEGRDESGAHRAWYVRLWNYAQGTPTDAMVDLVFDALDGGFLLPGEADRVWPRDIDRLFISLVPPDFVPGSEGMFASPVAGRVTLSEIECSGSGSVLAAGDAWMPDHGYGACTAYDDMYQLSPGRIVREIEASGFRGTVNHYIGMSHYPWLDGAGRVDPTKGMNPAALAWHRALAKEAAARGFGLIWSISYELLDEICPPDWRQRDHLGRPALTGYNPPSSLVSPARTDAIGYLSSIGIQLVGLSVEAGLESRFQVGEPWWWVQQDGAICCYDFAAKTALGGTPVAIADVRGALSAEQRSLLDLAGALLAQSTAAIAAAVKAAVPSTLTHLLAYLPTLLDPAAPELKRANLPVGWASPSFDRLQLEDYEWVTAGRQSLRRTAYELVEERLGYGPGEQHYLAGYAETPGDWNAIAAAADEARSRGVSEVFLWAMPQWWRDRPVLFGGEEMTPFDDILFPISIGAEASVAPGFSTNVVTSASGHEYRNANWSQARLRFDAGPGVRGEQELGDLLAFFRARRGPAVAFRFRDPFDHSSAGMSDPPTPFDQALDEGNAEQLLFPLLKRYGPGETRRITRPVDATVRVSVDGIVQHDGWTLDPLGVVRFHTPPAAGAKVAAGFLFDVPVRFAEDQLEISRATFLAGEAPSVPLLEVREQ